MRHRDFIYLHTIFATRFKEIHHSFYFSLALIKLTKLIEGRFTGSNPTFNKNVDINAP